MRERMSRPSSSVPNQCSRDGVSRRAGRLMEAGSCAAIQGANRAKITKMTTNTTPVAASGLWRAFPTIDRRSEMEAVDTFACGILLVNNSALHCFRGTARLENSLEFIDTPSPRGSTGIITLAGNSRQNPERKRVSGQNLENTGLASVVFSTVRTASALTILV